MISGNHKNRKAYNWLLYDIGDRFLENSSVHLRGVVYDLGCGEMPFRDWILQTADKYVGVDWSDSLHDLKADVLADLNQRIPIDDAKADTVISLSVMEHLSEPLVFLAEAHRILKPGGHMILQVPFMWQVHEAPHDYFRYTRFGLLHMLKQSGFTDIDIQAQTGFWVVWTLKLNYQLKKLVRGPKIIKALAQLVLWPIWMLNQPIAALIDKFWKAEGETAGYFVVARKL